MPDSDPHGGDTPPSVEPKQEPAGPRPRPPARVRTRRNAGPAPASPPPEPPTAPPPSRPTASEEPPVTAPGAPNKGDYEVGYGRPPKHTRFKPGQVANPLGRPKGAKSLSTLVDEALSAQIKVKIGGRTLTTSKRDVMVKQYVEKAMRGDMKAFAMLVKLDPKARILEADEGAAPASHAKNDDIVAVAAFLNRHTQPEEDEQ